MNRPFTVIWKRRLIEIELAEHVLSSMATGGLTDITSAMAQIDDLLSSDPSRCGESRDEFERVLIVPPLAVDFEVYEDEKVVYILRLRFPAPPRRI